MPSKMPPSEQLAVYALLLIALPVVGAGAPSVSAMPVSLSQVSLSGIFSEMQERNQEVLMSLNITEWGCHFTTTANITRCNSTAVPWHAFRKNGDKYDQLDGFFAAGNDMIPAQVVSFDHCESVCSDSPKCLGFTFQSTEAMPTEPVRCSWKIQLAFTPNKKSNCVAAGGVGQPSCAPLPGEMGLGGYYGHYQGHWLSATAFLVNSTQNSTVKARAEEAINLLAGVMDSWKAKYGYDGYLFPYDPLVFDKLLSGRGAGPYYSVPFYTLHKLMAGLLDQYTHTGSEKAFDLVKRMAGWVHTVVERTIASGGQDLWQRVLLTEWGGMNDVLFHLYSYTNDPTHLATARRFNGWVFTAPLANGQDDLSKLPFPHANFHLPEIIGNARAFELTGNDTDSAISHTFFDALTTNHSYSTGGSNSGECWQDARDLGAFLDSQTEESCTQYNVLKVARHLFQWEADGKYADFYERALLNGIVGNQNRLDSGMTSYIYMLPLGGVQTKPWGKSDYGFPCCWGTLSESFAKLGDSIYFVSPDMTKVFVNQFVPSSFSLPGVDTTIKQDAAFPESIESTTTLTVHTSQPHQFSLMIRIPRWADSSTAVIKVNNVTQKIPQGGYAQLNRMWVDLDTVEVHFPLTLWTAPLNDYHPEYNATVSWMYGPLVLAGVDMSNDIWVPHGDKSQPSSFITRTSTTSLEFEAVAADGSKIHMIPLRDVMLEKYVVYFNTAGTKPEQPQNGYCPHSKHDEKEDTTIIPLDDDESLVSAGPPVPPQAHGDVISKHRGVQWGMLDGILQPRTMVDVDL